LLLNFEQIIKSDTGGEEFEEYIDGLSGVLGKKSLEISQDFEKYIDLPTKAALSSTTSDVLGAIEINVQSGLEVKDKRPKAGTNGIRHVPVSLFSSGDGILMSYLAYFLAHLSKKSPKNYIWGFEEPENSLEYSKAQVLAQDFKKKFIKNAQIFLTTHSPAFVALKDLDNVAFFRVYILPQSNDDKAKKYPNKQLSNVRRLEDVGKQASLFTLENEPDIVKTLNNELHLVEFAQEIEQAVERAYSEKAQLEKENFELRTKLASNKINIISEGKNHIHIKKAVEMLDSSLLTKINFITALEDKTSDDQLVKLFNYEECNPNNKILFIWDCDAENKVANLVENNNTYKFVIPKNDASTLSKGIENIYPNSVIPADIYDNIIGDYGETRQVFGDTGKNKILDAILALTDPSVFDGYSTLLEKIRATSVNS
jgi:hypothetical protein